VVAPEIVEQEVHVRDVVRHDVFPRCLKRSEEALHAPVLPGQMRLCALVTDTA
jgi:hypothetical protein